MSQTQPSPTALARILIAGLLLLFACLSLYGIRWGLPSSRVDRYLFSGEEPWPGEEIYRLAGATGRFAPQRGADVDVDPLDKSAGERVPLTATDEDVAKIYLRFRLYTNQPDEMITMMALRAMDPSRLRLDPRLYQYGGLFIYPVGVLIRLGGLFGLIDFRGDVTYYLDHPDAFARFYLAARLYSVLWGLIGVWAVYAIARRLADWRAGVLAAFLFTLLPVVVCMAHEGKPHLPGAVLMLLAVLFAMRHLSRLGDSELIRQARRDWWLMCLCCGAAFGMVLSSLPIFVLIPLIAWIKWRGASDAASSQASSRELRPTFALGHAVLETAGGVIIASLVYLVTNPYILINVFANREVLKSNFGNSLAMYEMARMAEGFIRVVELAVEGSTLPIVALGVCAVIVGVVRRNPHMWPLVVPAAVFFLQFVAIGAGKPGEYGRFVIFFSTAFAIGTACLLIRTEARLGPALNWIVGAIVVLWVTLGAMEHLRNFALDRSPRGTRIRAAETIAKFIEDAQRDGVRPAIAVAAEPGPYCCPPMDFRKVDLVLHPGIQNPARQHPGGLPDLPLVRPVDLCIERSDGGPAAPGDPMAVKSEDSCFRRLGLRLGETPISWANKPIEITGLTYAPAVEESPSPTPGEQP
ncbi:MAG: glycosyltransferase family 39 protein [Phycisphaerales bacterium]|nr:MAG: glycosyltransferase family 39 protein [Phycisphaerales bacterium]